MIGRRRYPGAVPSVRIESASLDEPEVGELIAELNEHLYAQYPEEGAVHDRLDPAEVAPGHGVILVAVDGETGVALGCGAVRLRDPEVAEIKRMYVRPAARGRGIATALLTALEAEVAALFADRIVLGPGRGRSRRWVSTAGPGTRRSSPSASTPTRR